MCPASAGLDLVQEASDGELLGHAAERGPATGEFHGQVSGHHQEPLGEESVVLFRVLPRQARENPGFVDV